MESTGADRPNPTLTQQAAEISSAASTIRSRLAGLLDRVRVSPPSTESGKLVGDSKHITSSFGGAMMAQKESLSLIEQLENWI